MDLTALIELTRSLAGDPKFQDNTVSWEDEEIVQALNWAQTRYAELTHCTYKEAASTAPSDAAGIFALPTGCLLVDRVFIPDQTSSGPDATITAPATAPNGTSVQATVPDQAGASYFWGVAGGVISSGQGTRTLTFTAMPEAGAIATVSCTVTLGGVRTSGAVDVVLT